MKLQVSKDLRDEHEAVLTGLELLQAVGRSLERQGVSEEAIEDGEKMLEFFSVFGDGCHHAKEERYFFPEVERLKLPFDQDRTDKLVEEHEQGRGYIKSMRKVLDSLRTNEVKNTSDFGSLADEYTRMLSDHIDAGR
ncbi:MAG: hemerythrin domain-containing protein [Spirochaetia bacterium]|nr:hemerythrin domain-containing protein [Spirochaetia bacterium]